MKIGTEGKAGTRFSELGTQRKKKHRGTKGISPCTNLYGSCLIGVGSLLRFEILLMAAVVGLIFSVTAFAGTYSGGTGEPDDPYIIADVNDLLEMGAATDEDLSSHFVMVNDIDLAGAGDNPDGSFSTAVIARDTDGTNGVKFDGTAFTGVFDGNDYKIINLTIYTGGAGNDFLGLFGRIGTNSEVINLGLEDVNIIGGGGNGSECIGGLCGYNSYSKIFNCYVTGNVVGSEKVGGLCGKNKYGIIDNCYATGDIQGNKRFGGLCGYNEHGIILNCYATGNVTGGDNAKQLGGLCGENSKGTIYNCYATGDITGAYNSYMSGGLCGRSFEGPIFNCYARGGVTGGNDSDYLGGLCGNYRDGLMSNCYATGNVTTGSNSDGIGGLCGGGYGSTIINSLWDIETGGPDNGIGTGLLTSQMQTESTFVNAGWDFLGETVNGTSDFWVIQPSQYPELTTLSNDFGPYVFSAGSGTELDPYVIYNALDLGAIWQYPQACFALNNNIDLSGIQWSYAVVPVLFTGKLDGNGFNISNLLISGNDYLGLFSQIGSIGEVRDLGIKNVTITDEEDSFYLGGLCGYNLGDISNCYATGSITGGDSSHHLGGLCGSNWGKISNCYATNSVTGGVNSDYLGGLCGSTGGIITHCHATGNVNVGDNSMHIGGLCGDNNRSIISDCYATGNVTSGNNSDSLGGLCGYNIEGTISDCFALGTVQGDDYIGGLCGYNYDGIINSCYAAGIVTGGDNSRYLGGLCGWNRKGAISNCYAIGNIEGDDYIGGLCGHNYGGGIFNCYATGNVQGEDYLGGLCGKNDSGSFSGCFWDIEVGGPDNGIGSPLMTSQMQMQSTFSDVGWDFVTPVWKICEGVDYPRLWWEVVDRPIVYDEPELTFGNSNTVGWAEVEGAGEYYVVCCSDPNLYDVVIDSGWIDVNEFTFDGLESGYEYWYAVKARGNCVLESEFSDAVWSLQGTLGDAVEFMVDEENFKNTNMKNALGNKIDEVLAMIDAGKYKSALSKLEKDILCKTDGCANNGEPDKNDWIESCEEQSLVYPLVIETIEYVGSLME